MSAIFSMKSAALVAVALSSSAAFAAPPTIDMSEFTGDVKLACEAILCLPSSARPAECNPSIQRYHSIKRKKWADTVSERRKFLQQCPIVEPDSGIRAVVEGLVGIPDPNRKSENEEDED